MLELISKNICDLIPDRANARKHDERNINAIADSLSEFAQYSPLVVQKSTGRVLVGNGRLEAMKKLGWTEALVVEYDCDNVTATRLALADNRTAELATWDMETLEKLLNEVAIESPVPGWTAKEIDKIITAAEESAKYTNKTSTPIYEPTGRVVSLSECADISKMMDRIKSIDNADVTEEERIFLKHAATRFIEFSYKNIAEYYANASPAMQREMESLALVIIDIDEAIEKGFVKLTEDLATLFDETVDESIEVVS